MSIEEPNAGGGVCQFLTPIPSIRITGPKRKTRAVMNTLRRFANAATVAVGSHAMAPAAYALPRTCAVIEQQIKTVLVDGVGQLQRRQLRDGLLLLGTGRGPIRGRGLQTPRCGAESDERGEHVTETIAHSRRSTSALRRTTFAWLANRSSRTRSKRERRLAVRQGFEPWVQL